MEARIKKIFHRKRDDASGSSVTEDHGSEAGITNSALRTSLYDLAIPREPPQTGTLPFQGNSTRLSPNHISPLSASGRSLLSSRSPPHESREASTVLDSGREQQRLAARVSQRGAAHLSERTDEKQKTLPEIPVSTLSSSLSIDNEVSPRSLMQGSQNPAKIKDEEERGPIRANTSKEADDNLLKRKSRSYPASFDPSGSPVYESPTPSEIPTQETQHGARARATSSSRPMTRNAGMLDRAEKIVEKAQSNSARTEIIETIAPAVVHETIHQQVHEIRQEYITREVHNHEYYHRILPIVDVEVLPARHFLPVEGGGLVEINRDEVPGRGRQWVIAETASKTRSDQPVPRAVTQFSAREFTGNEGEFKKYETPEGFERTEQTWVHPPELETGGHNSGQTWPLELGGEGNNNIQSRSGPIFPGRKQPEQPPVTHPTTAKQ